jgi:hypothetical protein
MINPPQNPKTPKPHNFSLKEVIINLMRDGLLSFY